MVLLSEMLEETILRHRTLYDLNGPGRWAGSSSAGNREIQQRAPETEAQLAAYGSGAINSGAETVGSP